MWLAPVRSFSDLDIFQGDYPSWLFVSREFKVVKTVVIQDEPTALPTFDPKNLKGIVIVNVEGGIVGLFDISFSKNKHSPCPRQARNVYEAQLGGKILIMLLSRSYRPPCFHSHPSLSGLKNVCIRSLPSSSGILNGSVLMLSYNDTSSSRGRSPPSLMPLQLASTLCQLSQTNPK